MASKCCHLSRAVLACSVLVLLAEAVPASRGLHHRLQRRASGMKLCGRMLVEALAAICMSDYYGPSHLKRNYAYNAGLDSDWDDSSADGLQDPAAALDFFSVGQLTRSERGIADECCRKSCSYLQLVSYCGGPSLGK